MRHNILFLCAFIWAWAAPAPVLAAADAVTERALAAVGTPYVRGGATPRQGFDCSGLVVYVYRSAAGVDLPRRVAGLRHAGQPVRLRDLEPGDLLFYNTRHRPYSHVGIYVGEGRFVHAPRPGARVRVEEIGNRYWRTRFNGARRIEAGA
jgi:cell wall-associated NlpC family hydrolase